MSQFGRHIEKAIVVAPQPPLAAPIVWAAVVVLGAAASFFLG
ncbi:MAG: hypothetical protein AB7E79_01955 [Rhodospirillaceae bacterium]